MLNDIFLNWSAVIGVDIIRDLISTIFLFILIFIFIDAWD